ncbi:MAG TPA: hypothetical protein VFM98_10875, partial [Ramlibacter sp.]|uniref:hypothetical protein n=1 Tax=Ramlibacter sp. TaxID=1917967 RepID=UPI002D7E9C7B
MKTTAASAVALLIAGCGGGSDDADTPPAGDPPVASLQVSGTAATGLALASADVQVKCASGTATTTTDASGAYTVTLEGGELPCMIRVEGTAGGVEVTLHSVTEAGSADAATNQTSAVANVTPLTEIVVAQLTGGMPGDAFTAFSGASAGAITSENLSTAITAVLNALKDASGIDFAAIGDPFKAPLEAATASAPAQGNDYDKLLDQLGGQVAPEALPQLVTQVATAAASGSSEGLQDAMVAVGGGSLPNCPKVLSGKYRFLEYFGSSYVRTLNFKTMTAARPDGTTVPITVDAAKPCEFATLAEVNGNEVKFDVAMGAAGVGAARIQNITAGRNNIAWVFPEQPHTVSELVGAWTFHQGGFIPGEGLVHWPGKLDVTADGKTSVCDYEFNAGTSSTCTPDPEANLTVKARTDGGFDLMESSLTVANAWGYRAPNGSLTLFGTTNAAGSNEPGVEQTVLVLFKPQVQQLPAVGSVTNYWDVSILRTPGSAPGDNNATLVADSNTITAVDSATSSVSRERASDGRKDTFTYNAPLDGLRHRAQVPGMLGVYLFPLPGLNVALAVNSAAASTH